MSDSITPKVYVACLGCYNEGRLHGKWMDADEVQQKWESPRYWDSSTGLSQCKKPHHDEWAIHDYDGAPNLGEHPDIPYLIKVMQTIEEHGEPFLEWFNLDPHNRSHHWFGYDNLGEAFQDAYCGKWDSKKEFAEEFAESMGYIDSDSTNPLWRYTDFDWYWTAELRHTHDYSNGHVFRSDI